MNNNDSDLEVINNLYESYNVYQTTLNDENNRRKNGIVKDIELNAKIYLQQIEEKNNKRENERLNKIDYIISSTKEKLIKSDELYNMSIDEINTIYNKVKNYNKSWFNKFIEFIMGW